MSFIQAVVVPVLDSNCPAVPDAPDESNNFPVALISPVTVNELTPPVLINLNPVNLDASEEPTPIENNSPVTDDEELYFPITVWYIDELVVPKPNATE